MLEELVRKPMADTLSFRLTMLITHRSISLVLIALEPKLYYGSLSS